MSLISSSSGERDFFFFSFGFGFHLFLCMIFISVVSYLFFKLVGYLVDPKINHSVRKLTRIFRVTKNKKQIK